MIIIIPIIMIKITIIMIIIPIIMMIIIIITIIIIPGPLQRRGWTHRDFHRPFQTVARLPGQCSYLLKVGKRVIDYQLNINQNDHIQQKSSLSPALEYNEC